jgi:hypothetical protein
MYRKIRIPIAERSQPNPKVWSSGLQSIGQSSSYNTDFHDINDNSNNNCYISGLQYPYYANCGTAGYTAVTGYDLSTGWGSPNGQNLINAMTEPPSAPAPPFRPTSYRCSGNVSNPSGPTVGGNGQIADMSSGGGGNNNKVATCTYSGFTASTYLTTAPMTLGFSAYADSGAAGRATISVSLFGTVISGSYSGGWGGTIPVNTDLSTLTVTGYAKVSSIPGDEADVELGSIIIQ